MITTLNTHRASFLRPIGTLKVTPGLGYDSSNRFVIAQRVTMKKYQSLYVRIPRYARRFQPSAMSPAPFFDSYSSRVYCASKMSRPASSLAGD